MIQRMNFYHWTTNYIFPFNNKIPNIIQRMNFYHWTTKYIFRIEQHNTKYDSTYEYEISNMILFVGDFPIQENLLKNCTPQRDFVSRSGQETGDFLILRWGQEDRKKGKRDQVTERKYNIHIYKIERKVKIKKKSKN